MKWYNAGRSPFLLYHLRAWQVRSQDQHPKSVSHPPVPQAGPPPLQV
jgi:hypothetical protein